MAKHGLGKVIHVDVLARKRLSRANRAEEREQLPPCDGCGEPSYEEVELPHNGGTVALCYSCGKTAAKDDDAAEEPRELNFDE